MSGGGVLRRRALYLGGAALLVILLVGGRWLAIETAERAWARSFAGGAALVEARTLSYLLRALVLVFAVAWATGNLLIVYRAIGSVQMPRRLGNLEIVEAVSPSVLFRFTIGLGIAAGVLLALGTRDWWRLAVLAAAPPYFGISDETLGHDVGYYLGVLPWRTALHGRALLLTISAVVGVALLYAAIGSLRIRRARIVASDRARGHCGVLLACLALVIAWGAALDPAQVLAGQHGPIDAAALAARVPGARFVAAVAAVTALVSLIWAWRDWPNLILSGWTALLLALAAGYVVIPGVVRAGQETESALLQSRRATLERVAFGVSGEPAEPPRAFPSAEAAVRAVPVWDAERVAATAGVPVSAVALRPGTTPPTWLIAPPPDAPAAITRLAVETDSGLALTRLATADSIPWFGPGVRDIAIAAPDTWPALRGAGIALRGAWRRAALAWTLQEARLARDETDGHVLLWRRDVVERLEALAPFARFGRPLPAVVDSGLWWMSWGYVSAQLFPLARPQQWRDTPVRYLRAGLVGAVRVATGETHVWLAPGYDSLTAAWARHFSQFIEPAAQLPQQLRAQLPYPEDAFRLTIAQLVRSDRDSTLALRPREPFQLPGPDGRLWTAVGLQSGMPPRFEGLYVATLGGAGRGDAAGDGGPQLALWRPRRPTRLPGELVGSTALRPGTLRIWRAGGTVFTIQAQFVQPAGSEPPSRYEIAQVFVSLDERTGQGPTALAALRGGAPVDTSLAARWERARRIAVQADSALGSGDLELFARLFRQLLRQLAPPSRPR